MPRRRERESQERDLACPLEIYSVCVYELGSKKKMKNIENKCEMIKWKKDTLISGFYVCWVFFHSEAQIPYSV